METTNYLLFNRIAKNDAEIENIHATIAEINNEIKDLKLEDEKITLKAEDNF